MSEYELIELEEVINGVVLKVKAKPAARQNALKGVFNGALKVSVTTAPEKGKANKSIIKVLAKEFGLSPKYFSLVSGDTSSEKKFFIESVTADMLKNILSKC